MFHLILRLFWRRLWFCGIFKTQRTQHSTQTKTTMMGICPTHFYNPARIYSSIFREFDVSSVRESRLKTVHADQVLPMVGSCGTLKLFYKSSFYGFDYSGMSSGHYTANCKSSGGTWNHFDDTRVYPQLSVISQ